MADEDDDDLSDLIPAEVRAAYAEEQAFIDQCIARQKDPGWFAFMRTGFEFLPYVGDIFAEDDAKAAAATSNINRQERAGIVIKKIESGMQINLDEITKSNIRRDIYAMYNGDVADE